MELKPGELFLAEVDGEEKMVYLSLITDEKGLGRRDHCYRYAAPDNSIVKSPVKFISKPNQASAWRKLRTSD